MTTPLWFQRLTKHIPPGEFGRYLAIGLWNTAFGYATFALLTSLLMPRIRFGYIVAGLLASVVNITSAFLMYKHFVFRTKGNYLREWIRCVAVYGSGIVIGTALLPIVVIALQTLTRARESAPYVAGALLTGLNIVFGFLGHKKVSFASSSRG